ncbi:MAG: class I SAM-dependent methyltransferase, partial [Acetobacteraceae bacterium]
MQGDAERIIPLYDSYAAEWDLTRSRHLSERAWLDRFCALLPAGGSVLDLGCGMAEPIARHLIEAGYRVTGVDASPAMIALCRQRFPDQDWIVADMRGLALGRRFDGILAWDSFFHLRATDQERMFPIFRTHAAAGAALLFTSGPDRGEAIGCWQGQPLYHASLAPDDYRALLVANGFSVVRMISNDPDCT